MYQPKHFAITDAKIMAQIIEKNPLATMIAIGSEPMQINHIPMMLNRNERGELSLRCHVARANPVWGELQAAPDVLAIFCGIQAYISPNWYASKAEDGKVVPTWNYEAVHVRGTATVHDDPIWLRSFLDEFTAVHEANEPRPWQISDAPDDYLKMKFKGIVGIDIRINDIEGKAKLSQNQPLTNRESIQQRIAAQSASSAIEPSVTVNREAIAASLAALNQKTP